MASEIIGFASTEAYQLDYYIFKNSKNFDFH